MCQAATKREDEPAEKREHNYSIIFRVDIAEIVPVFNNRINSGRSSVS